MTLEEAINTILNSYVPEEDDKELCVKLFFKNTGTKFETLTAIYSYPINSKSKLYKMKERVEI